MFQQCLTFQFPTLLFHHLDAVKLGDGWGGHLWKKTDRSGVWLFRGALRGGDVLPALLAAEDWVKRIVPHSVVDIPTFFVFLLVPVRERHSYRATIWRAVLVTAARHTEGYRTSDEASVC